MELGGGWGVFFLVCSLIKSCVFFLGFCWERALSIFNHSWLQTASFSLLNKINNIYSTHELFISVIFNQNVKPEFFCHGTLKGFLEQVEIKETKMPCLMYSKSQSAGASYFKLCVPLRIHSCLFEQENASWLIIVFKGLDF